MSNAKSLLGPKQGPTAAPSSLQSAGARRGMPKAKAGVQVLSQRPRGAPGPAVPRFFGASSRARAMELLGQSNIPLSASPTPSAPPMFRAVPGPSSASAAYRQRALEPQAHRMQQPVFAPDTFGAPPTLAAHPFPMQSPLPTRRREEQEPTMRQPTSSSPRPLFIEVAPDAQIVANGYLEQAPLVEYNTDLSSCGLLGHASSLLAELLGTEDINEEVEIHHDPEWVTFPEVGDAMKANGLDMISICVALNPKLGKWAVGCGGKWKQRENAAKLGMCVALAADADVKSSIAVTWPDFAAYVNSGLVASGGKPHFVVGGARSAGLRQEMDEFDDDEDQPRAGKRRKRNNGNVAVEAWELPAPQSVRMAPPTSVRMAPPTTSVRTAPPTGALPRDVPLWVRLPSDAPRPKHLSELSSDVALVICTDGTGRKGLYSEAEMALQHVAAGEKVEYVDDADWKQFPALGKALKQIASSEECLTVGICEALDVWAVGVGMKGKHRYSAAKVALAAALALQRQEAEGELPGLRDFPTMAAFVEDASIAREGS